MSTEHMTYADPHGHKIKEIWQYIQPLRRQCGRCRQEHKIDIPVLVLWADGDSALGVNLLKGIEDEVPKVEVHVLENCSHWVQQDKCARMPLVIKPAFLIVVGICIYN